MGRLQELAATAERTANEIEDLLLQYPTEKLRLSVLKSRLRTARLIIELTTMLTTSDPYGGKSLLADEMARIGKLLEEIKTENR